GSLGNQFGCNSLRFGLGPLVLGLNLRFYTLDFGLRSRLDELCLAHPFGCKDTIHDFLKIAWKYEVLNVRTKNRDAISACGFLHIVQDVVAQAVSVRENVFKRHGGERPARCKLHVAVEALLEIHHGVKRCCGIRNAKLLDDAYPDSNLVRSEDFLAFDGELSFANVHKRHFYTGPPVETNVDITWFDV